MPWKPGTPPGSVSYYPGTPPGSVPYYPGTPPGSVSYYPGTPPPSSHPTCRAISRDSSPDFLMAKRLCNLIEASLPPPPAIPDFVAVMRAYMAPRPVVADPVHGVCDAPKIAEGSEKTDRAAVRALLEFVALCDALGAKYDSLDDMFIGWGRWSIRTQDLWADDANAAATLARRKEQAKTHGNLRVTLWPPSSFRTYVNAVARVYKRAAPTSILVPSSERQFPAFNVFFEQVHARERSFRASANATTATTDILRPQEYQVIMRDGTPRDAFEAQRRNILALVFCTGFRAEVLRRLTHTSFREGVDDAGGRQLTVVVGSMKNHDAGFTNADAALFRQVIMPADDPLLCPIAAVDRQRALPRGSDQSDPTTQWLFRTVRPGDAALSAHQSGEDTYRGVSRWVSACVGRTVTFKDVGRRSVMTRLANSPMPSAEVAKHLRVHRSTIAVYHRTHADTPRDMARILVKSAEGNGEASVGGPHLAPKRELPEPRFASTPGCLRCLYLLQGPAAGFRRLACPETSKAGATVWRCRRWRGRRPRGESEGGGHRRRRFPRQCRGLDPPWGEVKSWCPRRRRRLHPGLMFCCTLGTSRV